MVVNGHDILGMCIVDEELPFPFFSHGTCGDVIRHVPSHRCCIDAALVLHRYANPATEKANRLKRRKLIHT